MNFKVYSGALLGIKSQLVEVEATTFFKSLPGFLIVGLPDKTVEESKERIISALKNLNLDFKVEGKTIVNLAPADLKKEGSLFDLPIALSYLASRKALLFNPKDFLFAGELSLEGKLRKIKGAILLAELAKKENIPNLIIPKENLKEALLIREINVYGFETLKEVVKFLNKEKSFNPTTREEFKIHPKENFPTDFAEIGGHQIAKRALTLSAIGKLNVLMLGPPGTGKTLLAKALISILPPLEEEEIIELTKIYSSAGYLKEEEVIAQRPFRNPHHSASKSAIVGGGNPFRPGEITLAHKGVLFLDELAEFHRDVLESLRQPLEDKKILVSRSNYALELPADFIFIGASNPCPCGNFSNPYKECYCSPSQISKYKRKLSGPLADRIDIFLEIPYQSSESLTQTQESSAKIREKVKEALEFREKERRGDFSLENFEKALKLEPSAKNILDKFLDKGEISLRGYFRTLKVARSIADLELCPQIKKEHILEALSYRLRGETSI